MGNWHMQKGKFGRDPLPWYPMPFMEEYLDELLAQLFTDSYIRAVKRGLAHFAIHCRDENIKHPEEAERKHILRFQAYLQGKGYELSYRNRLCRYVSSWFTWMIELNYVETTPFVNIRMSSPNKKPDPLTEDELAGLFSAHRQRAFRLPPFEFHREEVILTMLYGWGLRIHELEAMNVQQVDMRLDYVEARNKGGGTKTLPYSDVIKQAVARYLPLRGTKSRVGEDALILGNDGGRLTHSSIRRIIVGLGEDAGVKVNPHRLRDTCGTDLVNADMPLERVAKILGHSDLRMTRAYSETRNKRVAEDHDRVMGARLDGLLFKRTNELDYTIDPSTTTTTGDAA